MRPALQLGMNARRSPHRPLGVLALLCLTGCPSSGATPPARQSPSLTLVADLGHESDALDPLLASRGQHSVVATIAIDGTLVSTLSETGATPLFTTDVFATGLCVIGAGRAAVVLGQDVLVVGDGTSSTRVTVSEMLGARTEIGTFPSACAGSSVDDLWVNVAGSLAHWDGASWTRERIADLGRGPIAVTTQYQYLPVGSGVTRRARSGGAVEAMGASTVVRQIDDTRAAVMTLDAYDELTGVALLGDEGPRATYDLTHVQDLVTHRYFGMDIAFSATGALTLAVLDSEGRSSTSFSGIANYYHAEWWQVVTYTVAADGMATERGHHDVRVEGVEGTSHVRLFETTSGPQVLLDTRILVQP